MIEATIEMKIPNNWVSEVCSQYPVPVKFLNHIRREKQSCCLVELESSEAMVKEMIEAIQAHPDVSGVHIIPTKGGSMVGTIETRKCAACRPLADSDCFLISAHSTTEGKVEWHLVSRTEKDLLQLVERLKRNRCQVELKSKTKLNKRTKLTSRQEQIIRTAIERGYYDTPKKISIEQLADSFDISRSTLGEILQKAEKKVMLQYFMMKD